MASPEVFCGIVSTTRSLMLALPVLSTVAAISRWPAEFTTLNCSFSRKEPLRVYTCVRPSAERIGKNPSPVTARSSALAEKEMLPWPNSWLTCLSDTPWPTVLDDFCSGEVAKMSPKSARERLKPVVPTFDMLLAVTPSMAVAAFSPVSEV